MARIIIDIPTEFLFTATIPVRISDLNYGGHVGNDSVLSIIHEGRMQFLAHFGYSEMNMGGAAVIMSDVAIVFKNELFYGDSVLISVSVNVVSKVSFDIFYKLEKKTGIGRTIVAEAKTGMVCFDYGKKRVVSIPDEVKAKWL